MRVGYLVACSVFVVICVIFAKAVKGDLLMPPTELLITPLSLGLFLGNFVINFVVFGLGYLFVVERDIKKIDKKSFLIGVFLITLAGFFSDSVVFLYYGKEIVLTASLLISMLIIVLDFLVCRFYLKLTSKHSIILGTWMGLSTNPFTYLILSFFLSLFLLPFTLQPQCDAANLQIVDSFCTSGIEANIVIKNIGTNQVNIGSPGLCDISNHITGSSKVCGSIYITRIDNGSMIGNLSASGNIDSGKTFTLMDKCTKNGIRKTCFYRFWCGLDEIRRSPVGVPCPG